LRVPADVDGVERPEHTFGIVLDPGEQCPRVSDFKEYVGPVFLVSNRAKCRPRQIELAAVRVARRFERRKKCRVLVPASFRRSDCVECRTIICFAD
jgi:hypothetical protein